MEDLEVLALRRLVGTTAKRRKEVAWTLGVNEQSLYQIVAGVPLESGKARGVGRALKAKLTRHFPGWMSDLGQQSGAASHDWKQGKTLDAPSSFTLPAKQTWEELLQTKELPQTFVVPMPDDALAPNVARGTDLIFSTTAEPHPLRGVLVQDHTGRRYIRRYAQGLGAAWTAQAVSAGYVSLESERDGLTLLAVMTGRLDGTI